LKRGVTENENETFFHGWGGGVLKQAGVKGTFQGTKNKQKTAKRRKSDNNFEQRGNLTIGERARGKRRDNQRGKKIVQEMKKTQKAKGKGTKKEK